MENRRPGPGKGNTRYKAGHNKAGEGREQGARGTGHRAQGREQGARGTGRRAQGREQEAQGTGRRAQGREQGAQGTGRRAQDREQGAQGTGRRAQGRERGAASGDSLMRLNRFIANSGICSRRDADEHIRDGHVTVNGKVVTDMGVKISLYDDVRFKGKKLSAERKVYIVMNKPKDYVTTVEDPHADKTVLDLLGDAVPERVYPVGRLDKSTTGILILTNDGELAGRLTHPKYKRRKIYHVFLDKAVTKNDLLKLAEGVELEDGTVAADAVSFADPEDKTQIGIELHSGQNRVVRRMFEKLGYKVRKLDRVYFAGLTKKNLPRGKWRFLTEKEIGMLKRGIF